MGLDLAELVAPGRTAVVIVEAQRGVIGDESPLSELAAAVADLGAVEHMVRLAVAARAVGVRVVHATAENLPGEFGVNRNARLFVAARRAGADNVPGTLAVAPVPELGPAPGDLVLPRYHGLSPLADGTLDALLRNEGVTTMVIVGVSLNVAIPNAVFEAVNRSYQVVVASDAVAGVPVAYGEEVLRHSLSVVATVVTTDDIVAAWGAGP